MPADASLSPAALRYDWSREQIAALFALPFTDLLLQAQTVHRQYHAANTVQLSTLLSIKTGACPEDCAYCPQSVRFDTGLKKEPLMQVDEVLKAAQEAKASGATRFCMGAAWRSPKDKDIPTLQAMVKGVKDLGLESCLTLGMLSPSQATALGDAGLDYYNHNLDTSPEYYEKIISTRTYDDRLQTLQNVRAAGVKVCCGGIVGMGEAQQDRVGLLHSLATLNPHPDSVPINELVQVAGTPMQGAEALSPLEFVRTIAVARIVMPQASVRLSAGRTAMSDETQALCFMAGASSIFYGEKLLTTANPQNNKDRTLLAQLGMQVQGQGQAAAAPAASACDSACNSTPEFTTEDIRAFQKNSCA